MSGQPRSITLPNPGLVLTTYIVINHVPTDGEWDIKSVEICADPEGQIVLGDCSMNELPRDTQEQIYEALEALQMTKRGMRRLWNEIHAAPISAQVREVPQL